MEAAPVRKAPVLASVVLLSGIVSIAGAVVFVLTGIGLLELPPFWKYVIYQMALLPALVLVLGRIAWGRAHPGTKRVIAAGILLGGLSIIVGIVTVLVIVIGYLSCGSC